VPYQAPGEDEQSRRAARLAELGLVRVLDAEELNGERLADALATLLHADPLHRPRADLDLEGARASADLLWQMASARSVRRSEAVLA
jgi:predicted glycosyltransferase